MESIGEAPTVCRPPVWSDHGRTTIGPADGIVTEEGLSFALANRLSTVTVRAADDIRIRVTLTKRHTGAAIFSELDSIHVTDDGRELVIHDLERRFAFAVEGKTADRERNNLCTKNLRHMCWRQCRLEVATVVWQAGAGGAESMVTELVTLRICGLSPKDPSACRRYRVHRCG